MHCNKEEEEEKIYKYTWYIKKENEKKTKQKAKDNKLYKKNEKYKNKTKYITLCVCVIVGS